MRIKKQACVNLFAAILLASPSGVALGGLVGSDNFSGSDDFNDNSKDAAKWGNDELAGLATLTETNSRIQLSTTGTGDARRPWILNTGSYTANWSLQLDVNVPTLTVNSGQAYGFELGVRDRNNPNNSFYYVDLEVNNFSTQRRTFFNIFSAATGGAGPDAILDTTSVSATLRIRYDAATTTLFSEFDPDGATNGYSFTPFENRSIAGWNMNAGSAFDATVGGFSQAGVVVTAANLVYGDNFLAVPEPSSAFLCLSGVVLCLKRRPLRPRNRRA